MAAARRKPKPSPSGLTHVDQAGRPRMVDVSAKAATARLAQLFQRNGYIRVPREARRRELGSRYKKGWEVRLVLKSEEELEEARHLVEQAGLKAGKAFKKYKQYAQPIYGKGAVDLFSRWAVPHD